MGGRIVDLSSLSRDSDAAMNGPGTVPKIIARRAIPTIKPIHEWDVDVVAMLTIDPGAIPNVSCVRWAFDVDSLRRSYAASVMREGWQHELILQGRFHPNETAEQAARREGVLRFLNELLAASYGVPA